MQEVCVAPSRFPSLRLDTAADKNPASLAPLKGTTVSVQRGAPGAPLRHSSVRTFTDGLSILYTPQWVSMIYTAIALDLEMRGQLYNAMWGEKVRYQLILAILKGYLAEEEGRFNTLGLQ